MKNWLRELQVIPTDEIMLIHYKKIVSCIMSCTTTQQLESCENMILTFKKIFDSYEGNRSIFSMEMIISRKNIDIDEWCKHTRFGGL